VHSTKAVFEGVALAIDGAGVLVIVITIIAATIRFFATCPQLRKRYSHFRQDLGRGILLGLEFLVAADIIRTVAVTPTLESVLVLAIIVLVRTFLSIAIEVELEGRWPWHSPTNQGGTVESKA
jgi:uncharacterized membrane protein